MPNLGKVELDAPVFKAEVRLNNEVRPMKIMMRDDRVFQGTPLQIVRAMQDIAFGGADFTVRQYIEWVAANALKFEASSSPCKARPTSSPPRWWTRWFARA